MSLTTTVIELVVIGKILGRYSHVSFFLLLQELESTQATMDLLLEHQLTPTTTTSLLETRDVHETTMSHLIVTNLEVISVYNILKVNLRQTRQNLRDEDFLRCHSDSPLLRKCWTWLALVDSISRSELPSKNKEEEKNKTCRSTMEEDHSPGRADQVVSAFKP